jgi:hypothetical protein
MYDRSACVAVALGDLVPFYQNAGHSTAMRAHESSDAEPPVGSEQRL